VRLVGYLRKNAFYVQQLFSDCHTVYVIMWKKYGGAGQATDDSTTRRMRFACLMTKANNTQNS
jgi:hypothetical protein